MRSDAVPREANPCGEDNEAANRSSGSSETAAPAIATAIDKRFDAHPKPIRARRRQVNESTGLTNHPQRSTGGVKESGEGSDFGSGCHSVAVIDVNRRLPRNRALTGKRGDKALEHVQHEMVSGVIAAVAGIEVVPLLVIHRNPHLRRISVIQTVAALEVFLAPEVLWVVDVRVVIEAVPITEIGRSAPASSVGPLVRRSVVGHGDVAARQHGGDQKMT